MPPDSPYPPTRGQQIFDLVVLSVLVTVFVLLFVDTFTDWTGISAVLRERK